MTSGRSGTASLTAALLALLLLSFASVQSIVMQVAMASAGAMTPTCGDGTDDAPSSMTMAMVGVNGDRPATRADVGQGARRADGHASHCPYCAVAAHAPVMTQTASPRPAVTCVFATYRVAASRGPRGPPTPRPRARDPPPALLIG